MVSPKPVPPYSRVVEPSACAKASKMATCFVRRYPDAGVAHADMKLERSGHRGLGVDPHRDLAVFSELDGVPDQVREELAEPVGMANERIWHVRRDTVGQLQAFLMGPQGQRPDRLIQTLAQPEVHGVEPELTPPRSWKGRAHR